MQFTLSESGRTRKRTGGGAVVSVLLHSVMLGGALAGTGYSKTAPSAVEVVDTLIYTPPKPIPAPPVRTPGRGRTFSEVPPRIPPIPGTSDPVVPQIDWGSIRTEPVMPGGEFVHTRLGGGASAILPAPIGGGAPYEVATVEKAVVPRPGNPIPRYPQFLASAGVEGNVIARFLQTHRRRGSAAPTGRPHIAAKHA